MLDVYQTDNIGFHLGSAISSPFHANAPTGNCASDLSFLSNYLPPVDAGSTRFRSAPPSAVYKHRHLRDNPFATSDEEADEDQIEAELQELGGQMVGSILDF